MEIFQFLSIFVKYSCFYQSKHEKSIQFSRVQVRQKFQVFQVQADKTTRSAFRLNRFLFVDMLFFRVRQNNRLFSSLSSSLQTWFKVWLGCFLREFTKLATGVSFFVLVASTVATVGPGASYPLTTTYASQFWLIHNAFLEHHVTTRQHAIMKKGIIIFKHNSSLKFSRLLAKLLATNCCT